MTKPKNYDQVPANKPIVDAIKAKKQDPSGAFVWTTYAALQSLQAGLNQLATFINSTVAPPTVKIIVPIATFCSPPVHGKRPLPRGFPGGIYLISVGFP